MATKQATFALLRLHAELGGKIKDNKAEAERLAQCMRHVEAVLKMIKARLRLPADFCAAAQRGSSGAQSSGGRP